MKRVSLILFIYYINNFFCSLIAEFLLPLSNILPRTYRDLSSIMKEIEIHYEAIHACLDDHVIYYNQHEFATECHVSRYRIDKVTKKGASEGSSLYSHHSTFATTIQVQKHSTIYGLPCQEQKSR